jgi:hypothetical protein
MGRERVTAHAKMRLVLAALVMANLVVYAARL